MNKKTTVWLIIAISLILIGCMIFGGVMTTLGWNFSKLSTAKYEINTHEVTDTFQGITMHTDTADICFVPSVDGKCKVVCQEPENVKHTVTVQDGTLSIRELDQRKWYEYIGINLGSTKITVYLPDAEYESLYINESTGNIDISDAFRFDSMDISVTTGHVKAFAFVTGAMKIKSSTGDIHVENASVGAMELTVSTGKVNVTKVTCAADTMIHVTTGKAVITDLTCKNLISDGDTGNIVLKNVIATEKFSIERTTGTVKFDGCDAAQIQVKTDTGDVTGTLVSEKLFLCKTDTGRVEVPQTTTGGTCEITTETGDIRLKIAD